MKLVKEEDSVIQTFRQLIACLDVSLEHSHQAKMLLQGFDVNEFSREEVVRILELAIDIRNTVQWIEAEADKTFRKGSV